MARKRMIDPRIWDSEQVMSLTPQQFKIYIFLISQADDDGRLKVSALFCTRIFPMESVSKEQVTKDLVHMNDIGLIQLYATADGVFIQHPNWKIYQTINKATDSIYPAPDVDTTVPLPECYGSPTTPLPPNRIEKNRREDKSSSGAESPSGLHQQIKEAFLSQHKGDWDFAKEGKHINGLIKRSTRASPEDPAAYIHAVMEAFVTLKRTGSRFWQDQPFLPSVLNSEGIWPRVLETMKVEKVDEDTAKTLEEVF